MADETGHERQCTGTQIFNNRRHEGSSQGLFKCPAGRCVLGLVPVGNDYVRDPFLCKAAEKEIESGGGGVGG